MLPTNLSEHNRFQKHFLFSKACTILRKPMVTFCYIRSIKYQGVFSEIFESCRKLLIQHCPELYTSPSLKYTMITIHIDLSFADHGIHLASRSMEAISPTTKSGGLAQYKLYLFIYLFCALVSID